MITVLQSPWPVWVPEGWVPDPWPWGLSVHPVLAHQTYMGDNCGPANSHSGSWKVLSNGELILTVFCLLRDELIWYTLGLMSSLNIGNQIRQEEKSNYYWNILRILYKDPFLLFLECWWPWPLSKGVDCLWKRVYEIL